MNNNLDEMQEQKLLRIEHNMAWLAFGGLLAAILGQLLVLGVEGVRYLLGEIAVFMVISIYLVVDCVRNGIWDRKIRPNDKKAHFKLGFLFCILFDLVLSIGIYRVCGSIRTALIYFAVMLAVMLVITGLLMALVLRLYEKRVKKLEDEP